MQHEIANDKVHAEPTTREYLSLILTRRILSVLFLGFSSGLPLALSGSTLQAWVTVMDVNVVIIGILSLTGQPYVYKFLWAPFLDRYTLPWLGRRRGWIICMQVLLVMTLIFMSLMRPDISPWPIAILALILAFISATQDTAIDAYVTDVLHANERGLGASMRTIGYRVGMLVSGGLALVMAGTLGWHITYLIMAGLLALQMLITWWAPPLTKVIKPSGNLKDAMIVPFKEFLTRDSAIVILLFIVIYKLGDALVLVLGSTFLLKHLQFSLVEIGTMYKIVGMIATLLGSFIGGLAMIRISLYQALLWFGILQAVSNAMFLALAIVGKNYLLLVATIFAESFCGGLGTVAFVAFLMSLCDARYTASQFALFSAVSAVGRVFIGPLAGVIVFYYGWTTFYFLAFLGGIPALFLVLMLRRQINNAAANKVAQPLI